MSEKRVIVIGGGAAGLMAAGFAAQNGAKVTVFEKMHRVGRKIMITGKGRCNLANECDVETVLDTAEAYISEDKIREFLMACLEKSVE